MTDCHNAAPTRLSSTGHLDLEAIVRLLARQTARELYAGAITPPLAVDSECKENDDV